MKTRYLPSVILIALFTGTSMPASAHEEGVYESLGHIPIGRIFLSADERARLDKMRGKNPGPSGNARSTGQTSARASNKDAAGFIVSDSGATRVWKNGDFVATDSARNVRFPGQVNVKSDDKDRKDTQETDTSSVGAGDEKN